MTRPRSSKSEQTDKEIARQKQIDQINNKPFSLNEIKEVLQKHHWECVFEFDAPNKIYERLKHGTRGYWLNERGPHHTTNPTKAKTKLEKFVNSFVQCEIYCPHEGIDRREEYNMNV